MIKANKEMLRSIPAVDKLLLSPNIKKVLADIPRGLVLKAINQVLGEIRTSIEKGEQIDDPSWLGIESVSNRVIERANIMTRSSLHKVINATGVVVHTNLGRSLLAEKVFDQLNAIGAGYSNLEYDLDLGKRGSRYSHVEGILKELSGAEAAMVVNNNAAAVLISLETLAKGREVVVSRGQLVEIGGSFRIPDVMKKSGARMVEVGTTNKTHLKDYMEAIGPDTALLLKVHRSNFQIVGFTEDVETSLLAELGKKHGLPVMEDLGSGCLIDLSKYGLTKEPTVQEILAQGVDLVTFSGDKLLGGPQAGIILGRKDLVESIKANQLNRALRIDKLTLVALEQTLKIYRDEGAAIEEIPTLNMVCQDYKSLRKKARRLARMIGDLVSSSFTVGLCDGGSKVGGGAMPLQSLPTMLLCLKPGNISTNKMEEWLKSYDPPIIVRVEDDNIMLDLRTIQEDEMKIVARAIKELAAD